MEILIGETLMEIFLQKQGEYFANLFRKRDFKIAFEGKKWPNFVACEIKKRL